MSIILKALKRADESKPKESKPRLRVSVAGGKRLWSFLALGATAALSIVFIFYVLRVRKPEAPHVSKPVTPAVQSPAPTAPAPETKQASKTAAIPARPDARQVFDKALEHEGKGEYASSEKLLREAVSIEPGNASFHNHLGFALKKQARLKDAMQSYEKALRLKPDYYEAMNNLAVALEASGQVRKAEKMYQKALSVNPSYESAHLNYALFLESEGREKEASGHYESFLSLSKDEELKKLVRSRLR